MGVSDIAPGWYKDPAEPTTQRYWTGEEWIGEPLPVGVTPPAGPPVPPPTAARQAAPRPAPTRPPGIGWPGTPGRPPGTGFPGGAPQPGGGQPGGTQPGGAQPGGGQQPGPGQPPQGQPGQWPGGQPGPWGPGQWGPWGPPGQLPPGAGQRRPLPGLPPGSLLLPVQINPHGYPLAPLGLRFLARLIDLAVITALSAVATGWLAYLVIRDYAPFWNAVWAAVRAGQDTSQVALPAVSERSGTLVSFVIPLIIMVLWWVYEVPAIARNGQTIGKRLVGIKVVGLESTQPLGIRRAFTRWNPLGVPVIFWSCFGVGFVLQLIDSLSPALGGPLNLALHDRTAATVVIRSGRRGHEITPIQPPVPPVRPGGQP